MAGMFYYKTVYFKSCFEWVEKNKASLILNYLVLFFELNPTCVLWSDRTLLL